MPFEEKYLFKFKYYSILVAGIANEKAHIYGLQFHPEVDLTKNGKQIFKNFLYDICGLSGSFTLDDRQTKCIQYIKEKVKLDKVR